VNCVNCGDTGLRHPILTQIFQYGFEAGELQKQDDFKKVLGIKENFLIEEI